MSKKIMKRSLALGALMAFVITGSAWAEVHKVEDSDYSYDGGWLNPKSKETFNITYHNFDKNISNQKSIIGIDGATVNIANTIFSGAGTKNIILLQYGSTLNLKDVTFNWENESTPWDSRNYINNNGTVDTNVNFDGNNDLSGMMSRGIYWGKGTLTFISGSETTIEASSNNKDITNRSGGRIIVENGAVLNLLHSGIDLDFNGDPDVGYVEIAGTLNGDIKDNDIKINNGGILNGNITGTSTVNLEDGMLNGNVTGTSTVNLNGGTLNGRVYKSYGTRSTVEFNGGTWNMTGDSTIKHLNGVLNVQGEGNTLNVIDDDSKGAIYNSVVKDAEPIGNINVGKLYAESTANALSSYGDLAVKANEIELKAGSNGIYLEDSGSEVTMNTNKLTVNAKGNGINVNKPYDTLEITGTGENSIVTITADGNGVITRDGYDVSGGHDATVLISADTVNVTSTGVDEVSRYDKGNAILAQGKDSIVTVKGGAVNITSGKDGVTALKGGTAIVTGNNIKIDVDSAKGYDSYVYGVHTGERSIGNGNVTIGDDNTQSVVIEVNGKDATGIFSRAYNNSGKAEDQSSVTVKGALLDITVDGTGDGIAGVWAASGTETKGAPSSKITLETATTNISATNGVGIVSYSNGTVDVKGNLDIDAKRAIETRGYAKTLININKDKTVTIDGDIAFTKEYDQKNTITDAEVVLNLSNDESYFKGNIYVDNYDSVVNNKATYKEITGMALGISNGAYWETQAGDNSVDNFVNDLTMSDGIIKHNNTGHITVSNYSGNGTIEFNSDGHLHIDSGSGTLNLTAENLTKDKFNDVAGKLGVKEEAKGIEAKLVIAEEDIVGETTGIVTYAEEEVNGYYHGFVAEENITEKANTKNQSISDAGISLKLHWRSHMNDMNKRMGELRDANGEHGVWTRMVRGESEYKNTKAQYNQYQLGYDEKLSVDKRWTVGAAVTFSEGDASYGYGSTEDKSTAFAIYGSKLNNDGTFVDLIARYAHLESDVDDQAGTGSYSANGMSVSAEVGKRIQQGNGLWIEPQAELTYGTIDSAEYKLGTKTVEVGDMDSLIGRIGFRIGKDIEKGNVYARASYLYDFEGETENAFRNDTARRSFNEDLGGGWWEVGVGANINLSKATYVYADVEKTFGGEVDTNWQWNLGVRYSF